MYNENLSYGLFLSDRQLDFLFNYPQGFDRMKCLATFMRMAVLKPTAYEKKGFSVELSIGQIAISEVELAKLWKCNRKTVSKIVAMFDDIGLVTSETNNRTTIFTVKCVTCWYCNGKQIANPHYTPNKQLAGVQDEESQQLSPQGQSEDAANNDSMNYLRQAQIDERHGNDASIGQNADRHRWPNSSPSLKEWRGAKHN